MNNDYKEMTHSIVLCADVHGHNCTYCPYAENGKPRERCMEDLLNHALITIETSKVVMDRMASYLRGNCACCRWQETAKCASCIHDVDAWNTHEDNWTFGS